MKGQKDSCYHQPWVCRKTKKNKGKRSKKQKQAIQTKNCARKKINYQASESSESEIETESESESKLTEDKDFTDGNMVTEMSTKNIDIELSLKSLWKSISPSTKEDILQQWYGCIYHKYNKPKGKKESPLCCKSYPSFSQ